MSVSGDDRDFYGKMREVDAMPETNVGVALNRLAREQLKLKLMLDIRMDISVCQLEGIEYKDYLRELKSIIDGFLEETA